MLSDCKPYACPHFYRHRSLGQLARIKPNRRAEIFNLFLARKEYQHVSNPVTGVDLEEGTQSGFYEIWLASQGVKYMNVVLSSLNVDQLGAARVT
jgi:hypothetical protein